MEIRKHKVGNTWIFDEYDFYINGKIVAELRAQLVGTDYVYLYFLPKLFRDSDRTRIDCRYMTSNEVIEKAAKIVNRKLYLLATNILSEIREIKMEE